MTIPRTLPASFAAQGFLPPQQAIRGGRKFRGIMIGLHGLTNTGKTEFCLSAPAPGLIVMLDRGTEVFNNPSPPKTRQDGWGMAIVRTPKAAAMKEEAAKKYWEDFKTHLYAAVDNVDCRSVVLDGDSDSWELQRLVEFGRIHKVPSHLYTLANSARRQIYARLYDSGKIIFATNKVKKEYRDKINPVTGQPELDDSGRIARELTGGFERQGFEDQEYLWAIQLQTMYGEDEGHQPSYHKWGVEIVRCKANRSLEGYELWGEDCHFAALMETVYPDIPLSEWGF